MKEYLTKMKDGSYKLIPSKMGNDDIEIPEGATAARLCDDVEFYKNDFGVFFSRTSGNWLNTISPRSVLMKNIVWQRAKQREELPFVDDEMNKEWERVKSVQDNESINDQYAEIEQVRQESQVWSNRPVGRCQTVPIDEASLPDFLIEDTVNHPSHYASGEIECIDAIESSMTHEAFCGYLKGNVQKYMWRYENKGGITDLEKAQWYLNKLISRIG